MYEKVLQELGSIQRLCRDHHVLSLSLTGSAAAGDFDPARSDLDFLVSYQPGYFESCWDDYWGLKEGLESLFHRSVDLIDRDALRNRYIKQSLFETEKELYRAE